MVNLNQSLSEVIGRYSSKEIIGLLNSINVAVSEINSIEKVIADPLVKDNLLSARDEVSGRELTLAPPPFMSSPFKRD